jgi:hypothetical protein
MRPMRKFAGCMIGQAGEIRGQKVLFKELKILT